jgi:hypothetical protein
MYTMYELNDIGLALFNTVFRILVFRLIFCHGLIK